MPRSEHASKAVGAGIGRCYFAKNRRAPYLRRIPWNKGSAQTPSKRTSIASSFWPSTLVDRRPSRWSAAASSLPSVVCRAVAVGSARDSSLINRLSDWIWKSEVSVRRRIARVPFCTVFDYFSVFSVSVRFLCSLLFCYFLYRATGQAQSRAVRLDSI